MHRVLDFPPGIASPGVAAAPGPHPVTGEPGLWIESPASGGRLLFPGPLLADTADLSGLSLELAVYQDTGRSLFLHLRFWEGGEPDGPNADFAVGIFPGIPQQVVLPLAALDMQTLFPARTRGRLKAVINGAAVAPERLTAWAVELPRSGVALRVWVGRPVLTDAPRECPLPESPVVDALGQRRGAEWPTKTLGEDTLIRALRAERAEPPAPLEGPFGRYGGWTERQETPTGFFRTHHDGARWWLIDPEGRPFFSVGPDYVFPGFHTPTAGREALFAWLPPKSGAFADAWGDDNVSFSIANLIRAFGAEWQDAWQDMTAARLRAWGFNTLANWSEAGLGPRTGMPYVWELPRFPGARRTIFRDFPDVFDPEYAADAARCAEALTPLAHDPLMIGYFLRNEPAWAFGPYPIGEALLEHPEPLHSKDALIGFLSDRYGGSPNAVSDAWGVPLVDWQRLKGSISAASLSDRARTDLADFAKVMVAEYVRIPAEACRRIAPDHLILGLRWCWVSSDLVYAGSEFVDAFSVNLYQMRPDAAAIAEWARRSRRPVLLGEFHAGALDAGLTATGLRAVADQADRGRFYRDYVEHAAAIPDLIGAHWFCWPDEPLLGEPGGENHNVGLVDVCHAPYPALVEAARQTHLRLYDLRVGLTPPTDDAPTEVPKEGF